MTQPGFSIAPNLSSGTKIWLYSSKGYVIAKYCSKKSRPEAVISKISSACWSIRVASESRHQIAMGMSPCLRSTAWYLPATTAKRYGGNGGVVLKCHSVESPPISVRSTDPFAHTRHALGHEPSSRDDL